MKVRLTFDSEMLQIYDNLPKKIYGNGNTLEECFSKLEDEIEAHHIDCWPEISEVKILYKDGRDVTDEFLQFFWPDS